MRDDTTPSAADGTFDGTFDGWRTAARAALAAGRPPTRVVWRPAADPQHALPLDSEAGPTPNEAARHGRAPNDNAPEGGSPGAASPAPPAAVPRRFLGLAALVACHRDPERWAALYRVLWRLTRGGEPHLLAVAVDPDVLRLTQMAKAVRREIHKLHAFVRFRLVRAADGVDEYVAWFEPEHDVVEPAAALFVRRFANMRWAVLTPRASVRWDGHTLAVGPGVPRAHAPDPDALEHLWGTYYAHIFNPARVKLRAMRAEMPKRYWRNLPEAALIAPLVRDAPARVRRMLDAAAAPRPAVRAAAEDTCLTPTPPAAVRPPDAPPPPAAAPGRVGRALVYAGSAAWEHDDPPPNREAPAPPRDAADRLRRYAARAPLAVVESTRARVFAPALARLWATHAPPGFLFDVHAHAAMLGGAVRPHQLPRAIRDLLPAGLAGAERVPGPLVPAAVRDALWERFLPAAATLAARNALGAVLLRPPRPFAPTRANADALGTWLARLAPWPVAVDFPDPAWGAGRLRARTDALLARHGATRILAEPDEGEPAPLAVVRRGDPAWVARVARRADRIHVIG